MQLLNKLGRKHKFYLLIAVVVFISMYAGLADYDWYWQCELGEAIIKDFNFNEVYNLHWGTKGVSEYLDHEWLTNILFYLCSSTGMYGISIAKLLICAAYAVATCYYLEAEGKEYNEASMIGILAYVFMMAGVFIKVKAYIISVVFLFVELVLLKKYKASSSSKYFLYMFVLLIVWNNMHSGSLPLFFIVAGVYWLTDLKRSKEVLFMLPIYIVGTFINPYGPKLVWFDLTHNFDPVMKEIVMDWRCIDAKETLGVLCALIVLGVVFFLIGTDLKAHLFDVCMIGVVLLMSLQSARHLIYLAPFFYSVVLDNKYTIKLGDTFWFLVRGFCVGICALSLLQAFGPSNYKTYYGADYIEPDLLELLQETNSDTCDGLFATDIGLWQYDLKPFTSGAFPCTRERALASYELGYSASEARIEELIDEWGLTKFVAIKHNPAVPFGEGNGVLYAYLSTHDEYKLLYDSDFYYYFVRKDLL